MSTEHCSRRDILRLASLATLYGGVAATLSGSQILPEYAPHLFTEALEYSVLPARQPSPIKKGGIGFNAVFLPYRHEIVQEKALDFAEKNGATFLRVFFDCPEADYEPKIGVFNDHVLSSFSSFCRKAAERNLSLDVALSDGYRMGACLDPNPIYGSKNVLGPYYQPDKNNDQWTPFYTDPHLVRAFKKRTRQIAGAVSSTLQPFLDAGRIQLFFEPMNEPQVAKGKNGKAIFNTWLGSMSEMLQTDYNIPCITGVAAPDTVDLPLVNTLHYYPSLFDEKDQLSALVNRSKTSTPVFIEETGAPDKLLNLIWMHDQRLFNLLSDIFLRTTKIDHSAKTIQPLISPLLCL